MLIELYLSSIFFKIFNILLYNNIKKASDKIMKKNVSIIANLKDKYIKNKLYNLNKYLLKQEEKVAYAYKNLKTEDMFSFNLDTCFYSASTIKFLVCLYLYQEAEKNPSILNKKLKLKNEDFKQGTGVLKNNKNKKEYNIKDLIYYTLKESDNTAYSKLVNFVTVEKLKQYGANLGAKHTLEGKDLFGITNCYDMIIYLTELYNYLNKNTYLGKELKKIMANPSYQIIKIKNINKNLFIRKYGSFGVAFHEVGIVYDKKPYILVILTQKNNLKLKINYVNKVAKKINQINNLIVKNIK